MRRLLLLLAAIVLAVSGCVNRELNNNKNAAIPTQHLTNQPTLALTEQPTLAPTEQSTQNNSELTYEELLDLPRAYGNPRYRIDYYWTLQDAFEDYTDAFVASLDILSVKFYYGWDYSRTGTGYTIVEARINSVLDEYNTANAKPGDIVQIYQSSYIVFSERKDLYAFFSKKYNTTISGDAAFMELKEREEGFFRIIPEKDKEYVYHIAEDEFPFKVGESYTMLCAFGGNKLNEDGKPYAYGSYICPVKRDMNLINIAERYKLEYAVDRIAVAEQISVLFR